MAANFEKTGINTGPSNEETQKSATQASEPIAGVPRKGIHSIRIPYLDLSAFDVIGTGALALGTSYLMNGAMPSFGSLFRHFTIWVILGFAAHAYFGVKTQGMKYFTPCQCRPGIDDCEDDEDCED